VFAVHDAGFCVIVHVIAANALAVYIDTMHNSINSFFIVSFSCVFVMKKPPFSLVAQEVQNNP